MGIYSSEYFLGPKDSSWGSESRGGGGYAQRRGAPVVGAVGGGA
jgi:hypothetical protein